MLHRLVGLALVAMLVLGITACGGGGSSRSVSAYCKQMRKFDNDQSLADIQDPSDLGKAMPVIRSVEAVAPGEIQDEFSAFADDIEKISEGNAADVNESDFDAHLSKIQSFTKEKCDLDIS